MISNVSSVVHRSATARPSRSLRLVERRRLRALALLLSCAGLSLALGCDDPSFCNSLCDDALDCGSELTFDECTEACHDELDVAREVGGSDCVAAREDYLDCAISDFCDGFPPLSPCRLDAVEGEIEACGEPLGEF